MSKIPVKWKMPTLRWCVLGMILFLPLLALSQVYTMYNLFLNLNLSAGDSRIYAFTVTLILVGLPVYASVAAAKLRSNPIKDPLGWMSVILTLAVTAICCLLLCWLRWQLICHWQAAGVFSSPHLEGMYGEIFLMFAPVMTALATLVISWFTVYSPVRETEDADV